MPNFEIVAGLYHHVIMRPMLPEIDLDDVVRLRKAHPCGSYKWKVVRLGADIGLECLGCQRRILLSRRKLARRLKRVIPVAEQDLTSPDQSTS